MREKGNVFIVDGGNLYWRNAALPENKRDEQTIRARALAEGTAMGGIDAMVPGEGDLALGWELFQELATKHNLPYVASNLECEGAAPLPPFRTVERNGLTMAFIGALPTNVEIPGCQVTDLVTGTASVVASLPAADLVVALGSFNTDQAQGLVSAAPRVNFIVSGTDHSLTSPRPLGPDHWMLGSGSRGKTLGLLTGDIVKDGQGWQMNNPGGDLATRLDRFRERFEAAQKRVTEAGDDEAVRARAERQMSFYQKEIEKMEGELAQMTAPRQVEPNIFADEQRSLSKQVADDLNVKKMVDIAVAKLPEKEKSNAKGEKAGPRPPVLKQAPAPGVGKNIIP